MKDAIRTRFLYFYDEEKNSDKVYNVYLTVDDDGCNVNVEYGRRGKDLKLDTKTLTPVSYKEALSIFDKTVASKMKKGYTIC